MYLCNDYEFLEKIKEQIDEENYDTGALDETAREKEQLSSI